jgi:hypothetical protein
MRVRVTFQINTQTGEVEVFQVDDVGAGGRSPSHDDDHEEIAQRLGDLIDPLADVVEVVSPPLPPRPAGATQAEEETRAGREAYEQGGD